MVRELLGLVRREQPGGTFKTDHVPGDHDDRANALALAAAWAERARGRQDGVERARRSDERPADPFDREVRRDVERVCRGFLAAGGMAATLDDLGRCTLDLTTSGDEVEALAFVEWVKDATPGCVDKQQARLRRAGLAWDLRPGSPQMREP